MSQLKEINGKYYKEVEVVMLEVSNEFVDIGAKNWYLQNSKVLILDNKKSNLYFLSDEEIKEGDWIYHHASNKVFKYDGQGLCVIVKKIIATTDELVCKTISKTLGVTQILPQPSPEFIQAFVEAYNQGKPIVKCLVEYNPGFSNPEWNNETLKLKYNQIIIKKLEEKMYSKSEVIELCKELFIEASAPDDNFYRNYNSIEDWITKNLKQNL